MRQTGFGNAAGFIHTLGVAWDPTAACGDEDPDSSDEADGEVDPVTGTTRVAGSQRVLEGMTEEERERAAEELYGLIQRLNAHGIIQCKLPEGHAE